jgi:hypothetical protein
MRLLLAILLSATTAFCQEEDWLPIPDGFVWPVPAKDAPDFQPEILKVKDLPAELQSAIKGNWENEIIPESVELFQCDLNGDKKKEIFLAIPSLRGTSGTFYSILTPTKEGYSDAGNLQGFGVCFLKPKNGWYQIECDSRGGGGNYTRCLLTFDGKEYVITRNEGHDFNRRTVEVRK